MTGLPCRPVLREDLESLMTVNNLCAQDYTCVLFKALKMFLFFFQPIQDSLEGLPRSACKRPKLDVTLDDWDLSGLPWWFLGNLRSNYSRRSNGSTDIHTNQVRTLPMLCFFLSLFSTAFLKSNKQLSV